MLKAGGVRGLPDGIRGVDDEPDLISLVVSSVAAVGESGADVICGEGIRYRHPR